MKSRYRNDLLEADGNINVNGAQRKLDQILEEIEPHIVREIAYSRYIDMLNILRKVTP